MRIWVYSPNRVVNEGLTRLIESLGYTTQVEPEPPPDLAIWNLCGQHSPSLPAPPVPTLALLCTSHEEEIVELLRLGYQGYIRPDGSLEEVKRAIEAMKRGEVWAERHIIKQVLKPLTSPRLTPKEVQVLSLLQLNLTNKEIARRLCISEGTVKSHVSSILEKFGAKNRLDLLFRKLLPET